MRNYNLFCIITLLFHTSKIKAKDSRPNIVFIMADDLGWNDVSFHGSDQIPTPNIDTLAYHGVILQQYYTDIASTPTRAALLTGKYPMRLGMQGKSLMNSENRGISLKERLLPSYLKDLGYSTHLVGKWHVGMSKEAFLPTNRGFDSFFGTLGNAVDYYTYNSVEEFEGVEFFGLDLYNGTDPVKNRTGYVTDLLTERALELLWAHNKSQPLFLMFAPTAPHAAPGGAGLQSPHPDVCMYPSIAHTSRRTYADIVANLDTSIGQIVSTLNDRRMLKNTIIVFVSDNGAPTTGPEANYGSNLPFRGIKNTPWEGGVRVPAVIWSEKFKSEIVNGLFHVTDWLPTLVAAAGGNPNTTIDGVNQWNAITLNTVSRRKDLLVTADELDGFIAYRHGDYKIVVGNIKYNEFYGTKLMTLRKVMPAYKPILVSCETNKVFNGFLKKSLNMSAVLAKRNATIVKSINLNNKKICVPTQEKGCLYNVKRDPLETHDLWDRAPELVRHMTLKLRTYWSQIVLRHAAKRDNRADPVLDNYVWSPWVPDDEEPLIAKQEIIVFPLKMSLRDLQTVVDTHLFSFSKNLTDYVKSLSSSLFKTVSCLFYNSTMCEFNNNNVQPMGFY